MKTMVQLSHDFLKPALHKQAICIDATLGRGNDAKFFLDHRAAAVYAFEIQEEVFEKTVKQLDSNRLIPFLSGHEQIECCLKDDLKEQVDAIIFNFGYCPNMDSGIETKPETSLDAIKQALEYLKIKGRMALVFYPHERWIEESENIEEYLKSLDPHIFAIQKVVQFNAKKAPFLLMLEKKKSIHR